MEWHTLDAFYLCALPNSFCYILHIGRGQLQNCREPDLETFIVNEMYLLIYSKRIIHEATDIRKKSLKIRFLLFFIF